MRKGLFAFGLAAAAGGAFAVVASGARADGVSPASPGSTLVTMGQFHEYVTYWEFEAGRAVRARHYRLDRADGKPVILETVYRLPDATVDPGR
jgi:hypothetical protein